MCWSKLSPKIIANQLKPLMSKLTGDWQSSSIPGRSAIDNIIMVQESVYCLHHRKCCNGGLIMKVDLEKAYDRVDWVFLEYVILHAGCSPLRTKLIMNCITTTLLSVCWNGEALDSFLPSRGLRQGKPLSPYLFVLCMEVLGRQISRACSEKIWRQTRISRGALCCRIFSLQMTSCSLVKLHSLKPRL